MIENLANLVALDPRHLQHVLRLALGRVCAPSAPRRGQHGLYLTHELTASRKALLKAGLIDAVIDHNNTVAARSVLGFLAAHFGRLP